MWGITQPFHDEIANELEGREQELNDKLKMLTSYNKSFQVTASYLLDLAQRAEQLFKESDEALQNKLLEYVLSNIELKNKKFSYILNDPFKTIVEAKKKALTSQNPNIWCPLLIVFRMECYKTIVSLFKEIELTRDMLGEYF